MLLIIWTVVLIVAVTLYLRRVNTKFSSYGIRTLKTYPFIGNMYNSLTKQKSFMDELEELYFKYPEDRFVGRYEFLNPILIIKDLDLIKKITFKDFEHFIDHRLFTDKQKEPIFARNLFSLRGLEWKAMRSTLTPAFTSSKLKGMVPFMNDVSKQMLKVMEKNIEDSGGSYEIDAHDLTTRFATDVIASCAFGLKVDSQTEVNNTFYEMGKSIATFKFKQLFIFVFRESFPTIIKVLNLTLFTEASRKYFTNLVLSTMSDRELKKMIRPDMIHLLMQAKKGKLSYEEQSSDDVSKEAAFSAPKDVEFSKKNQVQVWTDEDLVAQAVIFFIAGYGTVSRAMSFCLLEIARNPDVQEKLVHEIKEFDEKNNGKIDYTSIQSMPYLDMVVSEALRRWPPVGSLDRVCVKDYNMGKPNENAPRDYIVRKGDFLSIPAWPIHLDPKYYPNPEKFDPERFSEENKHKIHPFAYMPFGLGPRNCIENTSPHGAAALWGSASIQYKKPNEQSSITIALKSDFEIGSRFALCEIKVFLYETLLRTEVSLSEKLRLPITMAKDSMNINVEGGIWVKFKVRN